MILVTEIPDGVRLTVRVVPRASKTEIVGEIDGALRVRLASPPVDGAANLELIKLFAKRLGVSRSSIEIVSGETSRTKQLRIAGVAADFVRAIFG